MIKTSLPLMSVEEGIVSVTSWNPRTSELSGDFDYIDLSSIDQASKAITRVTETAPKNAPSRARQVVASGDILVATVRPNLNAVAEVPVELDGATASTGFCVLRPDPRKLDSRYLYHWVRTDYFVREMVKLATGANYPAVSDRIVKNSLMPFPEIIGQKRIATILDKADILRRKRQQAIDLADQFLRSVFLDMFGDPVTNPKGWEIKKFGEVEKLDRGKSKHKGIKRVSSRIITFVIYKRESRGSVLAL